MFSQTRTRSPDYDGLVQSAKDASWGPEHTVPVGNVLVCDAGGHVEHDDTALAVDVVAITETTELLLTGGIPDVELDGTEVLSGVLADGRGGGRGEPVSYGCESEGVDLDAESGHVLLLELAGQMALDEGGLGTRVSIAIGIGGVHGRLTGGGEYLWRR